MASIINFCHKNNDSEIARSSTKFENVIFYVGKPSKIRLKRASFSS